MALTPKERKAELVLRGKTMSDIARALGVTATQVSEVVAGRRRSRRVEEAVAAAIEQPADRVFGRSIAASAA